MPKLKIEYYYDCPAKYVATIDMPKEFIIYETVTNKWVVEADNEEQAIDDMEWGRDNAYMHKVTDREVMVEE